MDTASFALDGKQLLAAVEVHVVSGPRRPVLALYKSPVQRGGNRNEQEGAFSAGP